MHEDVFGKLCAESGCGSVRVEDFADATFCNGMFDATCAVFRVGGADIGDGTDDMEKEYAA